MSPNLLQLLNKKMPILALPKPLSMYQLDEYWQFLLNQARIFDPGKLQEIYAILPCPAMPQKKALVFYDDHVTLSSTCSEQTLRQFTATNHLPDFDLIRQTIQAVPPYTCYKVPIINSGFVLMPLEKSENNYWLNPAQVFNLSVQDNKTIIELTNGIQFFSPLQYHALEKGIINSLRLHASYQRDFFPDWNSEKHSPLDYLALPSTPYLQKICRKKKLCTWLHSSGEFYASLQQEFQKMTIKAYQKEYGEP